MSKSKATTTDTNDNPIKVLRQGKTQTSSGKSTLGYEVGVDESGGIHLRVSSNDGGGMFSSEWVAFTDIQAAIKAWPTDQGITSMTFRKIFRGKSANTPGFLIAVLCAEGIIEPMGDKKRVHQACDPAAFLASVQSPQGGTSKKPKAKEKTATKAEASPEESSTEKVKTPATGSAKTDKTPRKSPAASRKTK